MQYIALSDEPPRPFLLFLNQNTAGADQPSYVGCVVHPLFRRFGGRGRGLGGLLQRLGRKGFAQLVRQGLRGHVFQLASQVIDCVLLCSAVLFFPSPISSRLRVSKTRPLSGCDMADVKAHNAD